MPRRLALAAMILTFLFAPACDGGGSDTDDAREASKTTTGVRLRVAPNDPSDDNIAILAFLPARATVRTGSTLEWTFAGPERHSVTFFPAGQDLSSVEDPASLFDPTAVAGGFDGTSLANSGARPSDGRRDGPFPLRFTRPGEYAYSCVIHPQMRAGVTVTDDPSAVESQAAITARGDSEYQKHLEEGRAAKKQLIATAASPSPGPDGSPTWTIAMGATTPNTDVLAFAPPSVRVKVSDRIIFVNSSGSPHTATFGRGPTAAQDPTDPRATTPTPGPSPQPLLPGVTLNTGLVAPDSPPGQGPPVEDRSYTYLPTTAGVFSYVCSLHVSSGMTGQIIVE